MMTRDATRMNLSRFEKLLMARQEWESNFEILMYGIDISGTYKTICHQLGKQHCQLEGPSIATLVRQIILQVGQQISIVSEGKRIKRYKNGR